MDLRLYEELMLLALHDQKGTTAFGPQLDPALGGAVLAELLGTHKIEIRDEGKRGLVTVVDRSPIDDPILDAALADLEGLRRRGDPMTTVLRLARLKDLRAKVALSLCRRGIVRETEKEILLLFRRKVYPTVNPEPEDALIARVRAALDRTDERDARTTVLIGLADTAGALSAIYDRRERKALKATLRSIREADVAVRATHDAVEALMMTISVTSVVT